MAAANDNSPAVLGTFFKDAGLQRRFQHREKNAGSILDQVRRRSSTTPEIIPVAGYGRLKAELNIELALCALSTLYFHFPTHSGFEADRGLTASDASGASG